MKRALFLFVLAASCSNRPVATVQTSQYDAECIALHKTCKQGGPPCCGGFCALYGYISGTCEAPLPDGSYCQSDAQCASGVCQGYQCGAARACAAEGERCQASADCCAGFCETNAYVTSWHTCVPPQANGAYCTIDRECGSGICRNDQCVAQACGALGTKCQADADCCDGSFCDHFTYAPPACTAPWPKIHYCNEDRQCQSGACVDYQCQ